MFPPQRKTQAPAPPARKPAFKLPDGWSVIEWRIIQPAPQGQKFKTAHDLEEHLKKNHFTEFFTIKTWEAEGSFHALCAVSPEGMQTIKKAKKK